MIMDGYTFQTLEGVIFRKLSALNWCFNYHLSFLFNCSRFIRLNINIFWGYID